jgi:asparagine synthase (glutamine-hydrolysing)
MCGIGVAYSLDRSPLRRPDGIVAAMDTLLAHRGPDGRGAWVAEPEHTVMVHRRLAIVDLEGGAQPMRESSGSTITFNGMIYNYPELREELGGRVLDRSDTAVILAGYDQWGPDVVSRLRGMFAFAIYDPRRDRLFCARDRFGIKPLYYTVADGVVYLASEVKALLPFVTEVSLDPVALADYLTFQFILGDSTLFAGIKRLLPGHTLTVENGTMRVERYWGLTFDIDGDHSEQYFEHALSELLDDSVDVHLRSDVPVAAYVSGGLDSSLVASLARSRVSHLETYHGHFAEGLEYDESSYGRVVAERIGVHFNDVMIGEDDVLANIEAATYAMDYPEAGPGLLPQYILAQHVAADFKVVLGGQGGDEMFGGYARYLVAYLEQCLSAAIDGTSVNGTFVATYESILPNLANLRGYKPMLRTFFSQGLFGPMDRRYFDLVDRSREYSPGDIRWEEFGAVEPVDRFMQVFHGISGDAHSYFDSMTNFDFHTLLPALLHVEDRVSMAHGLESRVPLLDHPIAEFAATVPPLVKFGGASMKHLLREAARPHLPAAVVDRTDKMGFPTPLNLWMGGRFGEFVRDVLGSEAASGRQYVDNARVMTGLEGSSAFSRKMWAFLSLELWAQRFLDRAHEFRRLYSPD